MLFHLFIFFSNMNHSYPGGKLTITCAHCHTMSLIGKHARMSTKLGHMPYMLVDAVLHPFSCFLLPSSPFFFVSHYPPYFILMTVTRDYNAPHIDRLARHATYRTVVYSQHGNKCVINSFYSPSQLFPSHFFPSTFFSSYLSFVFCFLYVYMMLQFTSHLFCLNFPLACCELVNN